MVECDSHETPNMYPNLSFSLSNQQQFRLNKINEIKDYFIGAPVGMASASFNLAFSNC